MQEELQSIELKMKEDIEKWFIKTTNDLDKYGPHHLEHYKESAKKKLSLVISELEAYSSSIATREEVK